MTLRRVLLHVMLWSLGIAAVIGALGILVSSNESIWRIVGTVVTTAVAAGLMLPMTIFSERPRGHSAGVAGMALVIAEYLLGLALIWDFAPSQGDSWEQLALTMWWLALTGVPAIVFLRLLTVPMAELAARTGLVLAGVIFVLLMLSAWSDPWNRRWDVAAIAGVLAMFSAAGLLSLVGAGLDRRHWRYVGVLAAGVGAGIASYAIWFEVKESSSTFTVIATVAALAAVANVVLLAPLRPNQRWLSAGTLICAALAGAFVDVGIIMKVKSEWHEVYRLAGACGVLTGCGLLALAVMARLNRRVDRKLVLAEIRRFTLICPGCGSRHTIEAGTASCPTCRLIIHAQFEEPRCPSCDYVLFMLGSDRCPECGQIVEGQKE